MGLTGPLSMQTLLRMFLKLLDFLVWSDQSPPLPGFSAAREDSGSQLTLAASLLQAWGPHILFIRGEK